MSIDLPQQLEGFWPPERWRAATILVAVSGGADSVALVRALACLVERHGRGRLIVGHFHHGLRGADADEDERFVVSLAAELGLECRVGRGDARSLAETCGDGIEAAARNQRYVFLRHEAESVGARYVATAHTADDQAETILHRLVRGTGLTGLRGMARSRALGPAVSLIRPLLTVRRETVREYLASIGQKFRHDVSNDDPRFTRNRLRHELLPMLTKRYNPRIVEALLRLGRMAGEAQEVVDTAVGQLSAQAVRVDVDGTTVVDLCALREQPRSLVREVLIAAWKQRSWPLQKLGYRQWDELAAMVDAEPGAKKMFPGSVQAEVCDGRLRLTRR